jgi:methylglutaconyl-CoA hydratase
MSGPLAVRSTKRLIRAILTMDRETTHKETVALMAHLRTSPEGQEGLKAFLEKRRPNWAPQE